jgi:lysophospholipase L1-like esterase
MAIQYRCPQAACLVAVYGNKKEQEKMANRIVSICALALLLVNSTVQAVEFNNVVSLGDSLLDELLGFRNPLLSEHLADRLDAPLTNFARVGSTSAGLIRQGQHTSAAAGFGQGDLATLWIGGNDFFLNMANPFGVGIGNYRFIDRLEDNVDGILGTLRSAGMEVLVFNLPDMAAVPFSDTITLFDRQLANATEATLEWNDRLADLADEHGAHYVDVYSYFEEIASNPEAHTIDGNELVFGPQWGCKWCVFGDPIHPSALGQGLLANLAIDVLNEEVGGTPLEKLTEEELVSLAEPSLLRFWQNAFGQNDGGDMDGDGDTDGRDFLILQRQGNTISTTPASAVVPEPGTLALACGCVLLLCRRTSRAA